MEGLEVSHPVKSKVMARHICLVEYQQHWQLGLVQNAAGLQAQHWSLTHAIKHMRLPAAARNFLHGECSLICDTIVYDQCLCQEHAPDTCGILGEWCSH